MSTLSNDEKFFEYLDWYYYDEEEGIYKLKADAPKEAVDAYNEFYKKLDSFDLD